ncbi:conserved hypothetical protein [Hyella patelloides LEGE 07179]|uniref:Uncharacterized protein n=1 Tax=Hyella patelloides LEGE 07179 TaxID=945734 RepID=A0A563W390_9CYAN|nr:hypothetical protein [Hyella patelloides]VEP18152.1 conserved hypothetical protein [Hyella patelloides LEGE 07179]
MSNLINAIAHSNFLASITSELVKDEFDLLKSNISYSYRIINFAFISVTAIAGFVGLTKILSFKELKRDVNDLIERTVTKEIAEKVNQRIEDVERIVKQEAIVSSTNVKYCLPMLNPDIRSLQEYKLLDNRGFNISPVENHERKSSFSNCDVVVMDFVNGQFSDDEEVISILKKIVAIIPERLTIVIYIKRRVNELDNIFNNQDVYYTPANNVLTLMGRAIDAAQINKAFAGLKK